VTPRAVIPQESQSEPQGVAVRTRGQVVVNRPQVVEIHLPATFLEAIVAETTSRVLVKLDNHSAEAGSPWMNVETAARYLDCSVERIRKLKERRELPYHQEGPGCRVLFNKSDLDKWMDNVRTTARATSQLLCRAPES
jgi:excisionase family DNA binding protein